MDYQSNSKKSKTELSQPQPDKNIEKVISGEVVVHKKSLGRKFRDIFIGADFGSVVRYVGSDVLIPALRNLIVDASTKGIERMMYGDNAIRRRNHGPRITYNSPINRGGGGYRESSPTRPSQRSRRQSREDFILSSREEADMVLERMNDIIDQFEVVSVADLNELVGFPASHIDNKWGWTHLGGATVRQIREGYLIDLPGAEPI